MLEYKSADLLANGDIALTKHTGETREMPLHTHDFVEVVYICEGKAIERVNDAEYEVRRGDAVFINCGSLHAFRPSDKFGYINLAFRPEVLRAAFTDPNGVFSFLSLTAFDDLSRENREGVISFSLTERDEVEAIFSAMLREQEEKKALYPRVLASYLYVLLSLLARKLLSPAHEDSDTFRALADYIDENLKEPLTLPDLAQKCFYQPTYFSRLFREKFGMTLTEYINRRRIALATALLSSGNLPVEEVGSACGFATRSAFYRTFQKITGVTPGAYRKGKEAGQTGEKT